MGVQRLSPQDIDERRRLFEIGWPGSAFKKARRMARTRSTNGSVAKAEKLARETEAAVRDALIMHKRMGNPISDWQNDRVVWIEPEDIVIPDETPPGNSVEN